MDHVPINEHFLRLILIIYRLQSTYKSHKLKRLGFSLYMFVLKDCNAILQSRLVQSVCALAITYNSEWNETVSSWHVLTFTVMIFERQKTQIKRPWILIFKLNWVHKVASIFCWVALEYCYGTAPVFLLLLWMLIRIR